METIQEPVLETEKRRHEAQAQATEARIEALLEDLSLTDDSAEAARKARELRLLVSGDSSFEAEIRDRSVMWTMLRQTEALVGRLKLAFWLVFGSGLLLVATSVFSTEVFGSYKLLGLLVSSTFSLIYVVLSSLWLGRLLRLLTKRTEGWEEFSASRDKQKSVGPSKVGLSDPTPPA